MRSSSESLGHIPKKDVKALRETASFEYRSNSTKLKRKQVMTWLLLTRAVSETLGEERKWVHYGLTSTDVVDTALSYLLKQANRILLERLESLLNI